MLLPALARTGRHLLAAAQKPFLPRLFRRHCRLYCVGTPKSGTHSVARMFADPIRSAHEIGTPALADRIMAAAAGRLSEREFRDWLLKRDRRICLDVDSSTLNFFILDFLVREFEDSRFLLTIRDCYSWLNSMANHQLRYPQKHWRKFRDFRFRPDLFHHGAGERAFRQKGLYAVEGYLAYWARHNQQALAGVPSARLLVVRTDRISHQAEGIADFAGLPHAMIRRDRTHEFQNPGKYDILREIDRDYLEEKVNKHCRVLMHRFFPEITSLDHTAE